MFSDLKAWGWITFAVGCREPVSGIAVATRTQWARWTGVIVAGVAALNQLLFAQAYPLWSLMIMALDVLVIYGLVVYGGRGGGGRGVRARGSRLSRRARSPT